MTSEKARNAKLIREITINLAQWQDLVPIGQLAIFFHAGNSLCVNWGRTCDKAERRNLDYLKSVNPRLEDVLINAVISGSFKPDVFIHPFGDYHSTPGHQDIAVLPEFFDTADYLAKQFKEYPKQNQKEEFLSFVYMFFLIIHPFIDGNGRVARNLLDYYNEVLSFGLKTVWNNEKPKFCCNNFHKEAFNEFFHEEAKIEPYQYKDVYSHEEVKSLLWLRKMESAKLAERLIQYSKSFKRNTSFDSLGIKTMAEGIRKLHEGMNA